MSASENLHSKLVVWAKVTLPLLALTLLATLFLFARQIDPTDAIPYAEVDVEERARKPRLTQPTYAGVTADGSALSLSANEARPDPSTGATSAIGIVGRMQTPDGATTDLAAASAMLDATAGLMTLKGGVAITTSSGYSIISDALIADLDQTGLSSPGPVTATSPMGTISADEMLLSQDPKIPAAYLLVFKGRVKMLYNPVK